ncbi:MAG: hypothetical protein GWN84_22155 [Gammaproteobacteria bacterium]|nr:hypothetical protein [Gammaproteobacteria bacterium]NIR88872.1 hypothetical protein [Gammaproteobacteria bacterium]NIU06476.1 hypothetical protein [Gammaproteobacteria bacterium]NIV53368.1 hypothetical protein [Gammaproteobacteria bacterium]NIV74087.1 hypothetical protein [Gammaproteobacteria bacterium]
MELGTKPIRFVKLYAQDRSRPSAKLLTECHPGIEITEQAISMCAMSFLAHEYPKENGQEHLNYSDGQEDHHRGFLLMGIGVLFGLYASHGAAERKEMVPNHTVR